MLSAKMLLFRSFYNQNNISKNLSTVDFSPENGFVVRDSSPTFDIGSVSDLWYGSTCPGNEGSLRMIVKLISETFWPYVMDQLDCVTH